MRAHGTGSRTLPARNRRHRSGTVLWQSRSQRAASRAFGLVCGASDSYGLINRYARETIEAVGTSRTPSHGGDTSRSRRSSARRADGCTDYTNPSRTPRLLPDRQRELGGDDRASFWNDGPRVSVPSGWTARSVRRKAECSVDVVVSF